MFMTVAIILSSVISILITLMALGIEISASTNDGYGIREKMTLTGFTLLATGVIGG